MSAMKLRDVLSFKSAAGRMAGAAAPEGKFAPAAAPGAAGSGAWAPVTPQWAGVDEAPVRKIDAAIICLAVLRSLFTAVVLLATRAVFFAAGLLTYLVFRGGVLPAGGLSIIAAYVVAPARAVLRAARRAAGGAGRNGGAPGGAGASAAAAGGAPASGESDANAGVVGAIRYLNTLYPHIFADLDPAIARFERLFMSPCARVFVWLCETFWIVRDVTVQIEGGMMAARTIAMDTLVVEFVATDGGAAVGAPVGAATGAEAPAAARGAPDAAAPRTPRGASALPAAAATAAAAAAGAGDKPPPPAPSSSVEDSSGAASTAASRTSTDEICPELEDSASESGEPAAPAPPAAPAEFAAAPAAPAASACAAAGASAAVVARRPKQVIILGAGFDSRAYRLRKLRGDPYVRVIEVDQASVQAVKQARMRAGLGDAEVARLTANVEYVSANFEHPGALERALRNSKSFDPACDTLVLWEGVTYYLPHAAVMDTVACLRRFYEEGKRVAGGAAGAAGGEAGGAAGGGAGGRVGMADVDTGAAGVPAGPAAASDCANSGNSRTSISGAGAERDGAVGAAAGAVAAFGRSPPSNGGSTSATTPGSPAAAAPAPAPAAAGAGAAAPAPAPAAAGAGAGAAGAPRWELVFDFTDDGVYDSFERVESLLSWMALAAINSSVRSALPLSRDLLEAPQLFGSLGLRVLNLWTLAELEGRYFPFFPGRNVLSLSVAQCRFV